jgi:hypothetical protein
MAWKISSFLVAPRELPPKRDSRPRMGAFGPCIALMHRALVPVMNALAAGDVPWGHLSSPMQVIYTVGVLNERLHIPEVHSLSEQWLWCMRWQTMIKSRGDFDGQIYVAAAPGRPWRCPCLFRASLNPLACSWSSLVLIWHPCIRALFRVLWGLSVQSPCLGHSRVACDAAVVFCLPAHAGLPTGAVCLDRRLLAGGHGRTTALLGGAEPPAGTHAHCKNQ